MNWDRHFGEMAWLLLMCPAIPKHMNSFAKISTASALAGTFAAMRELGIANRQIFDDILRETLACNPQYLGVWTVWEPNALDGRDRDYANAPGHDGSGRFIPFWNRGGGRIHVEPNLGYDVPGFGDWYLLPRQRRAETVVDPYEFPFAGRPEFITSQVAPIFFRGQWLGAAGVDVAVDEFAGPEFPEETRLGLEETLERGFIFLNEDGGVDYWSARTRDILGFYIGRRLDRELPVSIANHLTRLKRVSRNGELPALRRGDKSLRLKFSRHPRSSRVVVMLEESALPAPGSDLTTREREVQEWLAQGKSNAEIGIILGISIHTVKRHVERILFKLGVENRCAAALAGLNAT